MNDKINITYFAKYVDRYGNTHYAVHSYSNMTRYSTFLKDILFDWPTKNVNCQLYRNPSK